MTGTMISILEKLFRPKAQDSAVDLLVNCDKTGFK